MKQVQYVNLSVDEYNWSSGQPSPNQPGSCAISDPVNSYTWYAKPCDSKRPFLCEMCEFYCKILVIFGIVNLFCNQSSTFVYFDSIINLTNNFIFVHTLNLLHMY